MFKLFKLIINPYHTSKIYLLQISLIYRERAVYSLQSDTKLVPVAEIIMIIF